MASKVQIISDAFVNLGKQTVSAPLVDNPIYAAASSIYDRLLPDILTMHPWRFAMKSFNLNRINEESLIARWPDIFQLPADLLLIYRTVPVLNYEVFGDRIYTNSTSLTLEYIFQASESGFPSYFTQLMVLQLTSRIAMTVTQLPELLQIWKQEAERQLIVARSIDSSIMPNPTIVRDPLVQAHFGSGRSISNGII